jgi:NADPH:quinone reductase-like Zn-dependent oxidoreductase
MKVLKWLLKWTGIVMLVAVLTGGIYLFVAYQTSTNDCESKTGAPTHPVKAIRYCEYGTPDVVKLEDVEKPVPKDNEVLIKVRAASLNALDAYMTRDAWLNRLIFGLRKPRNTRLGRDVAGEVEAVGKDVTQFKPGDEVFGLCNGSLAEYACALERGLVLKPANVTFEQAASIPLAGLTALQGLRNGNIQAGQKVLINGATGGVGTFGVQIAKSFGADVTAVCSTRNIDLVRSIGADDVIDYTKEDFTKSEARYDMIFDNVANHSAAERRRVLNPKGLCVLVGMGGTGVRQGEAMGRILSNVLVARVSSVFSDEKFIQYMTKMNKQDLAMLGDLVQTGKITPVIERTCKLSDAPEALRVFAQGHARGKVIITVGR